jgi:hypothetical protein
MSRLVVSEGGLMKHQSTMRRWRVEDAESVSREGYRTKLYRELRRLGHDRINSVSDARPAPEPRLAAAVSQEE